MTTVRLLQGLAFGLILSNGDTGGSAATGPGPGVSDAPPPKWMEMTRQMGDGKAFLFGIAVVGIGSKFWVLTLAAIGAIGDADLSRSSGIANFVAFALVTVVIHLAIHLVWVVAPRPAAKLLDALSAFLEKHNRWIIVGLGTVFGTWFLLKGLRGFGAV